MLSARTASFFAVYTAAVAGIERVRNDTRPNLVRTSRTVQNAHIVPTPDAGQRH